MSLRTVARTWGPVVVAAVLAVGASYLLLTGLRRRDTPLDRAVDRAVERSTALVDSGPAWEAQRAAHRAFLDSLDREAAQRQRRLTAQRRTLDSLATVRAALDSAIARPAADTARLVALLRRRAVLCDVEVADWRHQADDLAAQLAACQMARDTTARARDRAEQRLAAALGAADTLVQGRDADRCRAIFLTIPCPTIGFSLDTRLDAFDPALRVGVQVPVKRIKIRF